MLALEILGNDRKLAQTNSTTLRERPYRAQAESAKNGNCSLAPGPPDFLMQSTF
jgi:hypothetical protein